jgi:putative Holliday junction resolvase
VRPLGIDLGTRRIGVAVADSAGRVATAYDTVERSGDRARDHRRIAELAAEVEADQLVVGLPLSMDGSVGKAAKAALREADQLARATGLPVDTWDERLTTVTAHRDLMVLDLDAKQRRKIVDKVAAAVMLQAWLDHRAGTGQHAAPPDLPPTPTEDPASP